MVEIFNFPPSQASTAYDVIVNDVKNERPINLSLYFQKYVNKFVTGYLSSNGVFIEGKQSNLKRQLYLLRKEVISALEKIYSIQRRYSNKNVIIIEAGRKYTKEFRKLIAPIITRLEERDVDGFQDALRKLHKKLYKQGESAKVRKDLEEYLKSLPNVKLTVPTTLIPHDLYIHFIGRLNGIVSSLHRLNYASKSETLVLTWRMVINLGEASVYETSILLHRNFSVPYIPGSALKGVTRCWAILKFASEYKRSPRELDEALMKGKDLDLKLEDISFKDLIDIFGFQKMKGKVIFFDAFPIIENRSEHFITLDVMNVHYKDYYTKGEIPGDWMDPNPVFFLAVEGLKFKFTLLARKKYESLLDRAMALLIEALEKIGVGAKTSVGYGYFKRMS